MLLVDAIEALATAVTEAECFAILERAMTARGFVSFSHADADPTLTNCSSITTTVSRAWAETYRDEGFFLHDPVLKAARQTLLPFTWSQIPARQEDAPTPLARVRRTRQAHQVMEACRDHGYRLGMSIPIHGPGWAALLTGFMDMPDRESEEAAAQARHEMHLLAIYLQDRLATIRSNRRRQPQTLPAVVSLTPRMMEVLAWVSAGKTNAEVGAILGISPDTVKYHLKGAMERLDVRTRAQAIAAALQLGLIPLF